MYTRLVTVQVAPENVEAVVRLWETEAIPAARRQPGHVDGRLVVQRQSGKGISMFTWQTQAHAEATGPDSDHLRQVLAKFGPYFLGPPVVEHYEVAAQTGGNDRVVQQAGRYFAAWQAHDAEAILATMAPGGTYSDPTTPGPIGGEALRGYAVALWTAFPDLTFEISAIDRIDEHRAHVRWVMRGHNQGALMGLPPSGKAVQLEGIDLVEGSPEGIHRVIGLFDSATLLRQMGMNVAIQPG